MARVTLRPLRVDDRLPGLSRLYGCTGRYERSGADLEHRLLTFADAFRVAPLGNAQSAWTDEVTE